MYSHKRLRFVFVGMLAVGLLTLGGVGVFAEEDRYGGSLTIAQEKGAYQFHPVRGLETASHQVLEQVLDPLVGFDQEGSYVPAMAKSWENPDPLTWVFHLREGIQFHDGWGELTAEDVAYTWRLFYCDDFDPPRRRLFMVDEIEVVDDYTVKVHLDEPFAPFLEVVASHWLAPISKDYAEEKGHEHLESNPVGTGPFKFVEHEEDVHTIVERFEDYWRGRPYLEEVVFRPIPEAGVVTTELLVGGVDVSARVAVDDIPLLQDDPDVEIDTVPGVNYFYIAFNLWDAEEATIRARQDVGENPFTDIRVRKAMLHAVPWDEIIGGIFEHGIQGQRAYGIIPPSIEDYYVPELKELALEYDPEKAEELLEEAGYPDGFETRIHAPVDPHREMAATMAASYLEEIGFDVNIEVLEWATYLPKLADGDTDMFTLGWSFTADPYSPHYYLFHSDNWGPPGNRQRFKDEKVDELIDKAQRETDVEARVEMYEEIQWRILEQYPHAPLYHLNEVRPYNVRVQDFYSHAQRAFPLYTSWNHVWLDE